MPMRAECEVETVVDQLYTSPSPRNQLRKTRFAQIHVPSKSVFVVTLETRIASKEAVSHNNRSKFKIELIVN